MWEQPWGMSVGRLFDFSISLEDVPYSLTRGLGSASLGLSAGFTFPSIKFTTCGKCRRWFCRPFYFASGYTNEQAAPAESLKGDAANLSIRILQGFTASMIPMNPSTAT